MVPHTPSDSQSGNNTPGPIPCPRCGVIDTPTLLPGTPPHACKAVCGSCGRFIKWISLLAPAEHMARKLKARLAALAQRPPSEIQLAYLQALGDQGPQPANMREASERIDAARKGGR